jgi:hypothetical protein
VRQAARANLSTVYIRRQSAPPPSLSYAPELHVFSRPRREEKLGQLMVSLHRRDQRVWRRTFCNSARAWRRCCFCDAAGRHPRTYVYLHFKRRCKHRLITFISLWVQKSPDSEIQTPEYPSPVAAANHGPPID